MLCKAQLGRLEIMDLFSETLQAAHVANSVPRPSVRKSRYLLCLVKLLSEHASLIGDPLDTHFSHCVPWEKIEKIASQMSTGIRRESTSDMQCNCTVERNTLELHQHTIILLIRMSGSSGIFQRVSSLLLPVLSNLDPERHWNCRWRSRLGQRHDEGQARAAELVSTVSATQDMLLLSQGFASSEWKRRVQQTAAQEACKTIRMVEEICLDNERRCENIEEPLRREQECHHVTAEQLRVSEQRILDVGNDLRTRGNELTGCETKVKEAAKQNHALQSRLTEISTQFSNIKEEFDMAQLEYQQNLNAHVTRADDEKQIHSSKISEMDQALFERNSLIVALEAKTQMLDQTVNELNDALLTSSQQVITQQAQISTLEQQKADVDGELSAEKVRTHALQANILELDSRIQDEQLSAQKTAQDHEQILKGLLDQRAVGEAAKVNIVQQHRLAIEAQEAAIRDLENRTQTERDEMSKELLDNRRKADTIIADQRKEIRALREEQDVRAGEFEEAQELSRRLLAVVGMGKPARKGSSAEVLDQHRNPSSPQAMTSTPYSDRSRSPRKLQSIRQGIRKQSAIAPDTSHRQSRAPQTVDERRHKATRRRHLSDSPTKGNIRGENTHALDQLALATELHKPQDENESPWGKGRRSDFSVAEDFTASLHGSSTPHEFHCSDLFEEAVDESTKDLSTQ